jgi:hypothetical protein
MARLESPVGYTLEFQPPQAAQPKDASYNALLPVIANRSNSVADL